MQDMTDRQVEKVTRRYRGLTSAETVTRLREKYAKRREAVRKFTDRLEKSGVVEDAEVIALRALGVSEEEINDLVSHYAA
jgi:Holliday junction resolvasome RuvABC DNA-binding subunit